MRPAEIRYARAGDGRIAYRVIGQGSLDIVLVPGFLANLDVLAEDPAYGRLVKRLSAVGRLILLDRRGSGLSDGIDPRAPSDPEARAAEIVAVMDAAGCGRAALIGVSDGAALAIQLAATRPERVRALVLCGGFAQFHGSVMDAKRLRGVLDAIDRAWGTGVTLPLFAPGRAEDRALAEWWGRLERLSASPGSALALIGMAAATDVRDRLPAVRAPTLVLHAQEDAYASVEGARQLARAIAGARLVELAGRDHPIWLGDVERTADAIEEFLTGARPIAGRHGVLAVLLVARVEGARGGQAPARDARFLDERLERFRESVPAILDRNAGRADTLTADRVVTRFDSPARAAGAALALRESATALGLPIAQGIHVGEIDVAQQPLFGRPLDVAAAIAAAARAPEVLMSRIAADLVSGSGLQLLDHDAIAVDGALLPVVAVEAERHLEPARRRPRLADPAVLSAREREVLALVSEGLSNPHIAMRLGLSEHTVKRHVANILLKLDLPTRAAAAALMARQPAG